MEKSSDLTAEARIRRTALRQFADRGYDGTSVRAIADAAGVSPGLIIHHFGSKSGLRGAVTDEVVRIVSEMANQILKNVDESFDEQFDSAATAFRAVFTDHPEVGAYIRRLFFDADQAGLKILDQLMGIAREFAAAFEARGWMRPSPDPEMRNLQLIIIDIGPILFLPLLEAYFHGSPFDEEIYQRWLRSQYDLFAHGIFDEGGPLRSTEGGSQ